VWTPRGHPDAHQWLDTTEKALWTAGTILPKKSLTEGQTAGTGGGLTVAGGAVAGGCSGPRGNCIWALAVLSRARLALVVTGQSKLDGIATEARSPALTHAKRLVCASPGEVRLLPRPNMESETKLRTERQIPATCSLDPAKDLMGLIHT